MSRNGAQRESSATRDKIEKAFERWGAFTCRHAWSVIVTVAVLSLGLASQIFSLKVDNSMEAFLHTDDPIRIAYDEFRADWGRDEQIMLAIETTDVFALEFLERLRAMHEELKQGVPHLDDIMSMVNARNTRGEGDTLIVEDLLEDWPDSPAKLSTLRERVLGNPLYRNSLVTADATVTTVFIKLVVFDGGDDDDSLEAGFEDDALLGGISPPPEYLPEPEISRAVDFIREVIERYESDDFKIYLAGTPVMSQLLNRRMQSDMLTFTLYSLGAIAALLFLLYRRIAAVLLPMLVVVLSMLSTLGVMSLSGTSIGVGTQILPSFLLCVGVCDAVHLLAIYYQRLKAGDAREQAISFTLGHSGLAIVMTSLTTMGGLGSFMAAELKPITDIGIFAPIGVFFALIFTLVLMPAMLAVIPAPQSRATDASTDIVTRLLQGLGDFSARHPWSIVAVTVGILLVAGAGTSFLRFSHDPIDWFQPGDPFMLATRFMDDHLDGVNVIEVIVDTGEENGLYDPELLNRFEAFRQSNEKIYDGRWHISKTLSLNDVLKETHQALNENREEFYTIPQDRKLVAQELLLFENSGSDDLNDFVDPLFSTARITLRVPWMDAIGFPAKLDQLAVQLEELLPEGTSFEIVGLVPLMARTFLAMLESMARSYIIAIVIIVPLMILLIGNLLRGLLSMIPNLTPVILMLGYMGWSNTPVDGLTMMVGAIVLGLAVDDTIHFMHNFRRYYERCGDARQAIRETLETTGRALLVTSLVLSVGFFTFLGAYMRNVQLFGFLAGASIVVAFFANVILASSLMVLATRHRP